MPPATGAGCHPNGADAQGFDERTPRPDLVRFEFPHDAAAFKHRDFGGDVEHQVQVLLHDNDSQPGFGAQAREHLPNFIHDRGLDAFGGFIQQYDPRIGNEGAGDGQHLLFTAGQCVTPLFQQRFETWEKGQATVDGLLLGLLRIPPPGQP